MSVQGFAAQSEQTTSLPAELAGLTLTNAPPPRIHVAQAQDSAQLMVRIQQLEEQLRVQNGQIEGLTFQLTQLQEILNRLQEDSEFRFQALEGGAGGKTDAATQPGSVTQPEASPQDPNGALDEDAAAPLTDIPEQGVKPLPGEAEFDPTFDETLGGDELGNSGDPLVGTGASGGIDLSTGQPLNLSFDPASHTTGNPDADAQFAAGHQAFAAGEYDFAEDQFTQFLSLYPDNAEAPAAASYLGDILIQRGSYNEAADVLLTAYQKDPAGDEAAALLVKLGASISGAGEREVACRTFAQVTANYPTLADDVAARLSAEKTRAECPPA